MNMALRLIQRGTILGMCFALCAIWTFGATSVFAQTSAPSAGNPPSQQSQGNPPSQPSPGNPGGSIELANPLKFDSIPEFLLAIIDIILIFAVPIIVLFIMYAGFLYVTARGDTGQIGQAHSALTWAIIGGVIVLGAKILLTVIQGTVSAF